MYIRPGSFLDCCLKGRSRESLSYYSFSSFLFFRPCRHNVGGHLCVCFVLAPDKPRRGESEKDNALDNFMVALTHFTFRYARTC